MAVDKSSSVPATVLAWLDVSGATVMLSGLFPGLVFVVLVRLADCESLTSG